MATPGVPYNIVLQTGNGQNFLTFSRVAGATSYSIQRSIDGVNWTTLGTNTKNNYLDTTCLIGIEYYYQVASTNTDGTSSYMASSPELITPCLPGQINLGYLRYMAQLRADLKNSEFLTQDEWNFNLNQSAFELYDILITKFGDQYFLADPVSFVTNGQGRYPLPNAVDTFLNTVTNTPVIAPRIYKFVGADCGVAIGNNAWVTLPRFNWIDRNKFVYPQLTANALGVYNLSYSIWADNIWFIPPPAAGQYIQLWYIPVLNQMLQDTDMLSFSISGWSELVILDAAIKALLKEESDVQVQLAQKAALLERIETTAANRDVGSPNAISDIRGAAGFGPSGGSGWGPYGSSGGW